MRANFWNAKIFARRQIFTVLKMLYKIYGTFHFLNFTLSLSRSVIIRFYLKFWHLKAHDSEQYPAYHVAFVCREQRYGWRLCLSLCVCGDFEQIMPLSMIDRN